MRKFNHRVFRLLIFVAFTVCSSAHIARAALTVSPLTPPKLVVVVVIDQFRADMLTRYASEFVKPSAQTVGGFQFLMQKGAWYPFAQYQALEDMTCPGHATISTGAQPASNGITINDWYDHATNTFEYCVSDKTDGISPRHLVGTTFGDELRMAHADSRVISIALKDRAAVLLGGHHPTSAIWHDHQSEKWTTSTYYNKGQLPTWVGEFNTQNPVPKDFEFESTDGARSATRWTLDLATSAVRHEKLGHGSSSDVLLVSLSSHDVLGHMYGPESKEIHDFTVYEDKELARFLTSLKKEMGSLDHVVIALTADHGGAPKVSTAQAANLDAGAIDQDEVLKHINDDLKSQLGVSLDQPVFIGFKTFHFYLNNDRVKKQKLDRDEILRVAKATVLKETGVSTVFTRTDAEHGVYPNGMIGEIVRNSYLPEQSGDLILIPKPFYFEKYHQPATHMTGWSYDRSVPLLLAGPGVIAGVYDGAHPVDLAPTLSFLLGVLPPATADGHVLKEIFTKR